MTRRTALITDAEQRAALAVVRSLSAAGFRCVVTATRRGAMASASRHVARTALVPDALREPTSFTEAVAALAVDEDAALLLPIAEPSMLALLAARERLAPATIPCADLSVFLALSDKRRLLDEAATLGIARPPQQVLADAEALDTLDAGSLEFPVVLKPSRSVGEDEGARARCAVSYAAGMDDLRRQVRSLPRAAFPLLLQRRIVGPGTGVFLLLWEGQLLARFAHRRLCEKPPSGGVSVYRESIAMDEDLMWRSRALLERFGWSGVAMVEYKRDATTGVPYLMEVNGRFWGSLQLAIDAGVDFPALLARAALGEPVQPVTRYAEGVRSRWWWGQVDHLLARARPRRGAQPLPPGVASVGRVMRDLMLGPFRRDDHEEVFRWSDQRPFWNETIRWGRGG